MLMLSTCRVVRTLWLGNEPRDIAPAAETTKAPKCRAFSGPATTGQEQLRPAGNRFDVPKLVGPERMGVESRTQRRSARAGDALLEELIWVASLRCSRLWF